MPCPPSSWKRWRLELRSLRRTWRASLSCSIAGGAACSSHPETWQLWPRRSRRCWPMRPCAWAMRWRPDPTWKVPSTCGRTAGGSLNTCAPPSAAGVEANGAPRDPYAVLPTRGRGPTRAAVGTGARIRTPRAHRHGADGDAELSDRQDPARIRRLAAARRAGRCAGDSDVHLPDAGSSPPATPGKLLLVRAVGRDRRRGLRRLARLPHRGEPTPVSPADPPLAELAHRSAHGVQCVGPWAGERRTARHGPG